MAAAAERSSARPRGYVALLRDNPDFRRPWFGQIVSQLGDWLDYVALFTLLLQLTGSGTAAAGMLVARFLPGFFVSPLAGVVVDRLSRKRVMIAADLGRSVLVLGLLTIATADDIWLVYVVVGSVVVLTSFFEPARTATIPNVVAPEDLVIANAASFSPVPPTCLSRTRRRGPSRPRCWSRRTWVAARSGSSARCSCSVTFQTRCAGAPSAPSSR